ncbi:cystathionine beta-lyase [Roseiterribacter gracilis]|uniref:Cystathionine beta-lyase n=1 Tax=Roseiterribacter gracilis TaxID=2812848 RepID=A0A8S8X6I5_9PROT|nr:cystathionine beta-lyase [Rhodospirillales bacterium TMPK1]
MTSNLSTIAAHAGSDPQGQHGAVNTPVYRASTILFPTLAALEHASATPFEGVRYGRNGTPTTFAFEQAIAAMEGGCGAVSLPSGASAVFVALLSVGARAGDHLLVADNVYAPTRNFCDRALAASGVETTYFDPRIGSGIDALIRPTTRAIVFESPGSITFEICDVPAFVAAAKPRGIVTIIDNTWATPVFFRPLDHGVDISVMAATKYVVGHSDAMLGVISCRDQARWETVKRTAMLYGYCAGPDEAYLGLRGLRSMPARLVQHQATGLQLAEWLQTQSEVTRVLHPALPGDPGHALWKRDFTGASGLFGIVLAPVSRAALAAFVDGLAIFGMGWSWGGHESLIVPYLRPPTRTAVPWTEPGFLLRIHAGLEDAGDLRRDLEAGFERLRKAA